MLLGLRSLWEGGVIPPPPVPVIPAVSVAGYPGPGYILGGKPRKKPKRRPGWPGEEIEEEELEEILAMIGIDI